jgi:hypothetical protein
MLDADAVNRLLERNQELQTLKVPWLPLYQSLAMFILLRKQYFTIDSLKSPFMLNHVYDSTPGNSAQFAASSIVGQIMPNPYESFEFVPMVAEDDEVYDDTYEMFETVNDVMPHILNMPDAGAMNSVLECVLDMVIFGIGSIQVEDIKDSFATPVRYRAADAKVMNIDEDQFGKVDTVYLNREVSVMKVVQKYGYDDCSKRIQALYNGPSRDSKVKILHAIQPRLERDPLKLGNLDMAYGSYHVELDTRHVLQESGYDELPIIVSRFWKIVGEMQGRSPAMDALPDIRALNKLVEMFERAGEMGLDPPKMISSEDVLGAGKIPWGPGVDIPVHWNARMGTDRMKPIEIIQTVQNPSWALERIRDLRQFIQQSFMVQQLTDLNNTSRQTLGEAQIRNELRMFQLGPILNRVLCELLGPLLERSFNILLARGFFGVIRGSVQDFRLQAQGITPKYISQDFIQKRQMGLKGFRINFISPAARLMKLEEKQGLQELVATAQQMATAGWPSALDMINVDQVLRESQHLSGASSKLLNSPDAVQKIRAAKAQQTAQQMQLQSQLAQATALKHGGAGIKDIASAMQGSGGGQSAA